MSSNVLAEIARDVASPKLLPSLSIGLVNALILVMLEVSFAAMIFSAHPHLAARAAGLTLFGTFVLCLFMALTSSCRTAVTLPQDAPTAALTVVVPAVAVLLVGAC